MAYRALSSLSRPSMQHAFGTRSGSTIGFIGCGQMGNRMGQNLLNKVSRLIKSLNQGNIFPSHIGQFS